MRICTTATLEYISRQLREKKISQRNLADLTGLHPSSISCYIHGKIKPVQRNFDKIAGLLDLDAETGLPNGMGILIPDEYWKYFGAKPCEDLSKLKNFPGDYLLNKNNEVTAIKLDGEFWIIRKNQPKNEATDG